MRKFIQACALFTALFAFSAIDASAQINYGAEVKVPFAFSVGDESYDAGSYIIKVNRQVAGGATLTIQREDSDDIQIIMLTENGGSRSQNVNLVFNVENGQRYLTGLTTANNSYAFVRAKAPARKAAGAAELGGGANLY